MPTTRNTTPSLDAVAGTPPPGRTWAIAFGLPALAALAIVIASGTVHGRWVGRWSHSHVLEARSAALRKVPVRLGDWEGQDLPLNPRDMKRAEVTGYLMRRYVRPSTGDAVSVLIVCGLPGPVTVHTPEICYEGTGYEQVGPTVEVPIGPGAADSVWDVSFTKPGPVSKEGLRILYGWSADGTWKASKRPRWDYGGVPALYKMYVLRRDGGDTAAAGGDDTTLSFVRQLIPALKTTLFSDT